MTDPQKRVAPRQRSWLPIILVLLALAIGLGFVLWYYAMDPREPAVVPEPPTRPAPITPDPEAVEPLPDPTDELAPATIEEECDIISGRIVDFFNRLDRRDYIQQREMPEGSRAYFERLLARLLDNPPAVTGETDDIEVILGNTAHFYRVLGLNDLWLLKDVMNHQKEDLEELMALFYRWSQIAPECPDSDLNFHLSLADAYEYSGFFLNTLGGRSYLFRRDAKVRTLVTYYSVLILDRANEAGINRHGLDIRYGINTLLAEMPGMDNLQQREEYLATLTGLENKYQRLYGD